MDTFTQAYVECALWSSTDGEDTPLDQFDGEIAPETMSEIEADCAAFQEAYAELLDRAYEQPGYDASYAGHDFWLTRNGHGAGFWDRGLGEIGDELTKAAKTFGGVDLYIGDDELIRS